MSMQMSANYRRKPEPIQFHLLYAICFSIFLVAALLGRLLPWTWFARQENATRQQSIFEKARNAAGICATYAFII